MKTYKFKDVQFMTASDKQLVLRDWERFVKNICFKNFTERLYHFLTLHASFIAHYNRAGFYSVYFEQPEDTVRFLGQFDFKKGCQSVEYGGTHWVNSPDYADINGAMVEVAAPYLKAIYARCSVTEHDRDLTIAQELAKKHGFQVVKA